MRYFLTFAFIAYLVCGRAQSNYVFIKHIGTNDSYIHPILISDSKSQPIKEIAEVKAGTLIYVNHADYIKILTFFAKNVLQVKSFIVGTDHGSTSFSLHLGMKEVYFAINRDETILFLEKLSAFFDAEIQVANSQSIKEYVKRIK